MGRKRKPKPDDEQQSDRFIEATEKIQEEDSGKRFEEAVKKILVSIETSEAEGTRREP